MALPVERLDEYIGAIEAASVEEDITSFTVFLASYCFI
jgi:hypothetical protein